MARRRRAAPSPGAPTGFRPPSLKQRTRRSAAFEQGSADPMTMRQRQSIVGALSTVNGRGPAARGRQKSIFS